MNKKYKYEQEQKNSIKIKQYKNIKKYLWYEEEGLVEQVPARVAQLYMD